jgi:hypothetical protein
MQLFSCLAPEQVSQTWLIHSFYIESQLFSVGNCWFNPFLWKNLSLTHLFEYLLGELKTVYVTTICFKSTNALQIWNRIPSSEKEKLNIGACHLSLGAII